MKYIVAIQLLILSFAGLHAKPVTIEECKALARSNYPAVKQYELIDKIKDNTFSTIALYWLPNIVIGGQATLQNKVPELPKELSPFLSIVGLDMPGLKQEQYKAYIEASQMLWDGGRKKAAAIMAEKDAEEMHEGVNVELYALDGRIEDIYFGILLLDKGISQTENKLALLKGNFEKLNSYVSKGTALGSDAYSIEAEILTANQGLEKLKSAKKAYKKMLEIFTGKQLDDTEFILPLPPSVPALVSYRPELRYIDAGINKLNAQEKQVKANLLPEFGVFAQVYYGYPGLDYFQGMRNSSPSLNAIAGVRIHWNISGLTRKKKSIEALQLAKQRLEIKKDVLIFNNMLEAESKNEEINHLKNLLQDDERIVELRKKVRQASEAKLKNGVIDINDLLAKITAENEAEINKNTHEIQLTKAIYELKHSVNQ